MVTLIPIDKKKPSRMAKVSNCITIYESLYWFGLEMRSWIRMKIEKWMKTSASKKISNLVNGNTNSHRHLQTLILWTKHPILFQYMNNWTDSDRKWGLESESKSKNWKKTSASYRNIHLVIGNTNSHCSLQTLIFWTKYPILVKYMNLWNDSDRKWGLESESKSKIERKPLHHKDIPNLVNGNTNSHWQKKTFSYGQSIHLYYNIWISVLIWIGNEVLKPNENRKMNENFCIKKNFQFSEW